LAAFAHRHSVGMPYAYPDNELSYPGNFLNMMFLTTEVKYVPNPTLQRALRQYRAEQPAGPREAPLPVRVRRLRRHVVSVPADRSASVARPPPMFPLLPPR